jgi:catechol 2,3-dioxygenase-like lactoylglutathione lyase family enzyme
MINKDEDNMLVLHIDHFTLRSSKLEETKEFFMSVAGLQVGPRPAFGFGGYWLYCGERPLVHLIEANGRDSAEVQRYLGDRDGLGAGTGALDHIAFRCMGLSAFERRLTETGIAYRGRTVPELAEHQVFVTDPNDITVEFIFPSHEAASWVADAAGIAPA